MQRIPGHDDELSIDEEAGSAALLGEGRCPQGRAKAGLVTTAVAILGLACFALAYQVSPWHRAAAALGDHPRRQGQKRTRMFASLNSREEDHYTLNEEEIMKGDAVIQVLNTDIFTPGDCIVIINTAGYGGANGEAVVKSVGSGEITLKHPVKENFPAFSFIVVPGNGEESLYMCTESPEETPAPTPTPAPTEVPTPAPPTANHMWASVSGECTLDGTCVKSPNYPREYNNNQHCILAINLVFAAPIRVESFNTESYYDKLTVNGVQYSGFTGPSDVTPTTSIVWSSDGSATKRGWRLCTEDCQNRVPDGKAEWYDSDGPTYNCSWYAVGTRCAELGQVYQNFDMTASEACCACGGGSEDNVDTLPDLDDVKARADKRAEDVAIWASVKGCAMIEELQEQIDRAKGETKAELEARLATLKQDLPDCEEITSAYSGNDVWHDIKNTARLEELRKAAADAQASGSKKLKKLQQELKQAQAAVPSVDDVKQQASAAWQDNLDKLPDLHDKADADKIAEDAHESASVLVDTAFGSVKKWF